MRAVVHDRYGPPEVLRLEDVERPVPKDDEVLVRVHATTVNRTDCHIRRADPIFWRFFAGLLRPKRKVLGMEFAGEVEAVGAAVTEFEVGDHVFGIQGYNRPFGTHAEFVCVRESDPVTHQPAGMTFEEAAAVCDGALGALAGLKKAQVRPGQKILVYGASGSIGTAAVQLAKHFGTEVTAVCNTKNVDLVRSLGADHVIDYLREDFTQNGETYDVIFDAVGKHSFRRSRRSLKPGGVFLPTDNLINFALALATKRIGDKKVMFAVPKLTKKDVLFIKELIEAGAYRPVIDRRYPLDEVIAATKYVETGQKTGNVVLTLDGHREAEAILGNTTAEQSKDDRRS
jgi:NADPH:quinone reductase-like Zn-dependent oxidoreductase